MKKRLLPLLLALLLLISVMPISAGANEVYFISLNDTLLELSSMPAFVGATAYVPSRVFEGFRIYYNFFADENTAMVFTESKQFYFDLSNGNTYDGSNRYYSTQAILRSGQVYLPAKFICSQFGLTYSLIPSTGHGNILRITDGSAVLPDDRFLSAASSLMDAYYSAFLGLPGEDIQISMPENSLPEESLPEEEPDRRNTDVILGFCGLPTPELLELLEKSNIPGGFFLSPAEIYEAPDLVRRILSTGHSIGICCGEDPLRDYAEGAALLFDAARVSTLMLACPEAEPPQALRDYAEVAGLFLPEWDVCAAPGMNSAAVTAHIEFSTDRISVLFPPREDLQGVLGDILRYLKQNQFSIRAPRETDAL